VLFLLTVIVAGLGWRYWLWVLTSFTIAHSLTLVAGLLGWVQVPASIVEPLIAASIVWMAALNLRRAYRVRTHATDTAHTAMPSLKLQVGTVFACGLLHGLGFASSMDGMGLHGTHLIASLVGFNVGIELGQVAVLAATLVLMQLSDKLHQMRRSSTVGASSGASRIPNGSKASTALTPLQSPVLISGLALVLGLVWLVERLSGG
jgi:hypothetical protein